MKNLLTIILMLLITTSTLTAKTIYVKTDGSDSNNGNSWATAYQTLQKALENAVAGDEIWVANGTYKPTVKAGNGYQDRDMAFVLVPDVKLYGGFVGTETSLSQRQLPPFGTPSATILSGTISGGNAYHVVISVGNVGTACLDGFTIKGGKANETGHITINGSYVHRHSAGGIFIRSSSPTLTNVTISENEAKYYGGGIFTNNSLSILTNVTISGNKATDSSTGYGGGMYNNSSSLTLTNVTINGNTSFYSGGGMRNWSDSSPILTNVIISGNSATHDNGGGMGNYDSSPTLTNVVISGNFAKYAGAMYNYSSSPTLTNVTISGNRATSYNSGGMCNYYSSPKLYNTIIWENNCGIIESSSSTTYYYCLIQDIPAGGTGNLNGTATYPNMFINAISDSQAPTIAGNYRLAQGSPCIDAGNNSYNTTSTDMAGNPRIYNSTIDMGAYEYNNTAYSVSFNSQGGSSVPSQSVIDGNPVTIPTPDPNRDCFVFRGWHKEAGCINAWNFETDVVTSDITLYAKWSTTCIVTFNSQGGSSVAPAHVEYGNIVSQPTPPNRYGYAFKGWFKEANCINAWNFDTDVVTSDITLYAKWNITYTVTFDSQGGSYVYPLQVETGTTIPRPANPTKPSFACVGWFREASCVNEWNFNTDVVTSNITLYAKWSPAYTVMFYTNGGTAIDPLQVAENTPIGDGTVTTERIGHTLEGWYIEPSLVSKWYLATDLVTNHMALYAKWILGGIDDFKIPPLDIYPNPATNSITITGISAGNEIRVMDLSGRKVMELLSTAEEQTLNIESISAGMYIIQVGNKIGKLAVK